MTMTNDDLVFRKEPVDTFFVVVGHDPRVRLFRSSTQSPGNGGSRRMTSITRMIPNDRPLASNSPDASQLFLFVALGNNYSTDAKLRCLS